MLSSDRSMRVCSITVTISSASRVSPGSQRVVFDCPDVSHVTNHHRMEDKRCVESNVRLYSATVINGKGTALLSSFVVIAPEQCFNLRDSHSRTRKKNIQRNAPRFEICTRELTRDDQLLGLGGLSG